MIASRYHQCYCLYVWNSNSFKSHTCCCYQWRLFKRILIEILPYQRWHCSITKFTLLLNEVINVIIGCFVIEEFAVTKFFFEYWKTVSVLQLSNQNWTNLISIQNTELIRQYSRKNIISIIEQILLTTDYETMPISASWHQTIDINFAQNLVSLFSWK